ncbi:MAG: TIGR01244 family sulfur transferase, partial [Anaerolineae bacterium]
MDIKKISPFLSVSPQITTADVGILATQGYRTIICNRPDGETNDQPTMASVQAAAERHGIRFHEQPVKSGQVTDDDVDRFAALLGDAEGPVLAFCRTGTRSITLWALSEARHLSADSILAAAQTQGYDLEGLRARLDERFRG